MQKDLVIILHAMKSPAKMNSVCDTSTFSPVSCARYLEFCEYLLLLPLNISVVR